MPLNKDTKQKKKKQFFFPCLEVQDIKRIY